MCVLVVAGSPDLASAVFLMVVGGSLHGAYFLLLQRGYREGDLSLVYPLARGTGPLLATIAAIAVFGERPSVVALVGAAIVVVAVLSLGGVPGRNRSAGSDRGAAYAIATGVLIAAYTLWDKHAVDEASISPLLYYFGTVASRAVLLTPLARRQPRVVQEVWRRHRRTVIQVAVLSSSAYVLVLYALTVAPVSYVAPAREVSVLIGAALGVQLLAETDVRRRLTCAGALVAGVAALSLG